MVHSSIGIFNAFCVPHCSSHRLALQHASDRCRPVGSVELSEDPELRDFMTPNFSHSGEMRVFEVCSQGSWEISKLSHNDDRYSKSGKMPHITVIARRQSNSVYLLDCLAHSEGIERTVIWRSGVDDSSMTLLGKAFASGSCRIRSLHLPRNFVSPIGVQCLSKGLRSGRCVLHTLDLSDNVVGDKGCRFLAEALGKFAMRASPLARACFSPSLTPIMYPSPPPSPLPRSLLSYDERIYGEYRGTRALSSSSPPPPPPLPPPSL